jgi:hypothetical protein
MPSQPYFGRKSIEKVIFLFFSHKNYEKFHTKWFEKSMELGRKFLGKDMLYTMRYISHKSKAIIAQSHMTADCGLHGLAHKN